MPPPGPPIRIIAVDDDPADLQLLRRHLERVQAFEVEFHGFDSPCEAFRQALEQQAFDVAILDYHIGKWTGLDVLQELRPIAPDLPVIFLTEMRDEKVLIEMLRAGASDYMAKSQVSAASIERAVWNAHQKGSMQRQIDAHSKQLEQTVATLRVREQEMSGFYHVLSHELKTPLTAMREFVSIVIDGIAGAINPEQAEYLGIALRSCDQMRTLMNDILDATRMETGKLALDLTQVNVAKLLEQTVQIHQETAESKQVNLAFSCAKELPHICADQGRLRQVLNNLISNAIKFTDPNGSIQVNASLYTDDAQQLMIEVTDTGRGIAPDKIDYIFERLYQAGEDDYSIQGGLGLGLNISRGIIRSHEGEIMVESTLDQGSRFWFHLPITPPEVCSGPNSEAA